MKGFTGAQLLSVAAALAGLAEAKQINKARMVQAADMAAVPNQQMMHQGIQLTERGPHGGWRAWGYYGGGGGGGGGGSPDVDVDVNVAATVTADLKVSGTLATTVEQKCTGDHHQLCSPGYCADLWNDADHCGQCGVKCPKNSFCSDPEDYEDKPCECMGEYSCLTDYECHAPTCGDTCHCPRHSKCVGTTCKCIYPLELCSGDAHHPPYCANTAALDLSGNLELLGDGEISKRDLEAVLAADILNCGACGYTCPHKDGDHDLGGSECLPTYGHAANERSAHCHCLDSNLGFRICTRTVDVILGGGVCAKPDHPNYCGDGCEDCTTKASPPVGGWVCRESSLNSGDWGCRGR